MRDDSDSHLSGHNGLGEGWQGFTSSGSRGPDERGKGLASSQEQRSIGVITGTLIQARVVVKVRDDGPSDPGASHYQGER